MDGIKRQLYEAVIQDLLEHEFDINRKSNETEFSYDIKSNFDVEYSVSMSWFFGWIKKSVRIGSIGPKRVLEKIANLKDFRHLKGFESDNSDEIVRVICASYAMWKLGLKMNFGTRKRVPDSILKGEFDTDSAWRSLFEFDEAPKKTIKTLLVEENEDPIGFEFKNPIEAITYDF